jgi:OHCU decarboxylase
MDALDAGLQQLNALPPKRAAQTLRACCGSRRWAVGVAAGRPYPLPEALLAAGEEIWWRLEAEDWLQAFAAHPRIGEGAPGGDETREHAWSLDEQSGAASLEASTAERLAAANRRYEERFGYVFLVCASGKSGDEMLAAVERRLADDPAHELRVAAAEQAKITRLRLEKLLAELAGEAEEAGEEET